MLDEMQRDLLKEYVNVFIGQAASMLSEMANQRVLLTVPEVDIINMSDDTKDLAKPLFNHGHIISSSMKFGNDFSGRALLIFPAQKAKLLVDACMGMEMSNYDEESYELIDTDFDVLKEISNVILNSVIGEFSNLIGTTVEFSIPDIEVLFVSQEEQKMYLNNDVYMMMLYTSFELAEAQVEGVIIVALGLTSLNKLLDKISEEIGDAL